VSASREEPGCCHAARDRSLAASSAGCSSKPARFVASTSRSAPSALGDCIVCGMARTPPLHYARAMTKILTHENWLAEDDTLKVFFHGAPDGITAFSGHDWARLILEQPVPDFLPEGVRGLLNSARGAMCYGAFFYPLYTVGVDLLGRALETAFSEHYRAATTKHTGRSARLTFQKKIEFLEGRGVLTSVQVRRWHDWREFRNFTTHAEFQHIMPPGPMIEMLRAAMDDINELLAPTSATNPPQTGGNADI
jgi:hypothetical protein